MANQRDKSKVMIGVYVDKDLRDGIKAILESHGVTITDFIITQFYKLINKETNEEEILEKLALRDGRTKKAKLANTKKNASKDK